MHNKILDITIKGLQKTTKYLILHVKYQYHIDISLPSENSDFLK